VAIAFDVRTRFPATAGTTDTTTGNRTFSHVPAGTPKAVCVTVCVTGTAAPVTGVLYGGVKMRLAEDRTDVTEAGRVQLWVLESRTVPTGTQTVTLQGCIAATKFATCFTMTAATTHVKMEQATGSVSASGANPTATLARVNSCYCFGALHTGAAAPSASPLTGVTLVDSADYGALAAQTIRSTAAGTGSFALGVTLGADDYAVVGASFYEWTPADGTVLQNQSGTWPLTNVTAVEVNTLTIVDVEVEAGANSMLLCTLSGEGDSAGGNFGSGMTWDGNALTKLAEVIRPDWSWAQVWYLLAPPEGIGPLVATLNGGGIDRMVIGCSVYDGAKQSAPLFTTGNGAAGTSSSLTVSGVGTNDFVRDILCIDNTGMNPVAGADQTVGYNINTGASSNTSVYSTQSGANGGVMSWTWTGARPYSHIAYCIEQFTSGASKSGTDTTGAGSDTATVVTTLAGADADGTPADTATLAAAESAADASGAGADTSVRTAAYPVSDASGGTAESGSVTAPKAGADASGAAADASALLAAILGADTEAGSDTGLAVYSPIGADQNSAIVETGVVNQFKTGADVNGVITELAVQIASLIASDSGSGADAGVATVVLVVADTGSGAGNTAVVIVAITTNDVGAATEVAVMSAQISASDAASDSEVGQVSGSIITVSGTDSGSGSDTGVAIYPPLLGSDAGSDSESAAVTAPKAGADAASAVDAAVQAATVLLQDLAAATDLGAMAYTPTGSQGGTGADTGAIALYGIDQDGINVETGALVVTVTAQDGGAVFDLASLLRFILVADQSGAAIDNAIKTIASLLAAISTGRVVLHGSSAGEVESSDPGRVRR